RKLLEALFASGADLVLKNSNHTTIGAARDAHKRALSIQYEKKYFFTNSGKLWPGVLVSLATLVVMMLGTGPAVLGMLLWLSMWTVAVFTLVSAAITSSRNRGPGLKERGKSIGVWLFALPFILGELVGLGFFGYMAGWAIVPLFVA